MRLGRPLPTSTYTLLDRDRRPRDQGGALLGRRGHRRRRRPAARDRRGRLARRRHRHDRLDYARDRDQLLALVRADQRGRRWPPGRWSLVRHAHAVPRGTWSGADDRLRPLDRAGRGSAPSQIGPLLAAYGVRRGRLLRCGALRRHRRARMPRRAACRLRLRAGAVRGGVRGRTRRRASATCAGSSSRRQAGRAVQPRPGAARPARTSCAAWPTEADAAEVAQLLDARRSTSGWPRARCSSPTSSAAARTPGSSPSSATSPEPGADVVPAGGAGVADALLTRS